MSLSCFQNELERRVESWVIGAVVRNLQKIDNRSSEEMKIDVEKKRRRFRFVFHF